MDSSAGGLLERASLPLMMASSGGSEISEAARQRLQLFKLLEHLEIRPLTAESVARYKRAKLEEVNDWQWVSDCLVILAWLAWTMFVIGFVGAIVTLLIHFGGNLTLNVPVAFAVVSFVSFAISYQLNGKQVYARARWVLTEYDQFLGFVPDTARLDAQVFKRTLPEAKLWVHEMVRDKKTLDPFLSVSYGGREVFLHVWNEEGFIA